MFLLQQEAVNPDWYFFFFIILFFLPSTFDDGDRPQLDGLPADSSIVTRVDYIRHILVGLGGLRCEQKEDQ